MRVKRKLDPKSLELKEQQLSTLLDQLKHTKEQIRKHSNRVHKVHTRWVYTTPFASSLPSPPECVASVFTQIFTEFDEDSKAALKKWEYQTEHDQRLAMEERLIEIEKYARDMNEGKMRQVELVSYQISDLQKEFVLVGTEKGRREREKERVSRIKQPLPIKEEDVKIHQMRHLSLNEMLNCEDEVEGQEEDEESESCGDMDSEEEKPSGYGYLQNYNTPDGVFRVVPPAPIMLKSRSATSPKPSTHIFRIDPEVNFDNVEKKKYLEDYENDDSLFRTVPPQPMVLYSANKEHFTPTSFTRPLTNGYHIEDETMEHLQNLKYLISGQNKMAKIKQKRRRKKKGVQGFVSKGVGDFVEQ